MKINLLKGDCCEWMDKMIEENFKVDLVVTSPPYGNKVRSYNGAADEWSFEKFTKVADRLAKILKEGSVIVWVVSDTVEKGSETGDSFRQTLYFKDNCGLKLHDTMIYRKNSCSFWPSRKSKRYAQTFEYMFVFCKGKIRDDITLLAEHENKYAGLTNFGKQTQYNRDGIYEVPKPKHVVPEFSLNENIWDIVNACDKDNKKYHHPAIFPEKLADMHIRSWLPLGGNCVVFDPFMGSATTGKMALANGHSFVGTEIIDEYYDYSKNRLMTYFSHIELKENTLS